MDDSVSQEVVEKLVNVHGTERRFEEILLGVATYAPADRAEFFYTVHGLGIRLLAEHTRARVNKYYEYILEHCQDDWYQDLLDPLKLVFRLSVKKNHFGYTLNSNEFKNIAVKINVLTDFMKPTHREYF